MLLKHFNRGLYNLIKPSFLTTASKFNSRNFTFLSINHLASKTKIYQSNKTKTNSFITQTNFNFFNSRYNFSSSVERQIKEKEIQEVFDDIVAQAKEKYQTNGQYNLLFLINQARQVYPRLQSSKIQNLVILSKTLLTKAQKIKETIQKIQNPTQRKQQYENSLAQLSYWILLRIYVSSVAFKRVCLNIHSLETIQPNADVKKSPLQFKYSQKAKEEVFYEMEKSLAEFDAFKLKYKDSQVHRKIQDYIKQGLEEFSLCRKKNITKEERQKIKNNPKEYIIEKFKENESHFLHQMNTLRQAILKTDIQKVTQMYLTNSILTIMSDNKFQGRQSTYLLNSLYRLEQLSKFEINNYLNKVTQHTKSEQLTNQNLNHIQAILRNSSVFDEVIDFMVRRLVNANENLESTQRQRPTKSTSEKIVSTVGLLLQVVGLILVAIVAAWLLVWRVKSLLNKDESKKN